MRIYIDFDRLIDWKIEENRKVIEIALKWKVLQQEWVE